MQTPAILVSQPLPPRASIVARVIAFGIALGCLTLFLIAASLTPSHAGVATHRGLGLPACEFMQRTGLPCPSCGMTTSFSWFVRGNLAASLYVQPMGALIAALSACAVWVGLYVAFTGRAVYRLFSLVSGRYVFMPLVVIGLVAWAWKIFIHLSGRDGW